MFLMFLIYISDLVNSLPKDITIKLFADDIKLYKSISLDDSVLQRSFNSFSTWSREWQLNLAKEKCFACLIKTSSRKGLFSQQYCIEDIPLITHHTRDLDVIINSDLKFQLQIDNITHKAAVRSRLIPKSFTSRDKNLLIKAFCIYVRPLLEYSCQIWNPHHKYLIENIERFKRNLLRPSLGLGS